MDTSSSPCSSTSCPPQGFTAFQQQFFDLTKVQTRDPARPNVWKDVEPCEGELPGRSVTRLVGPGVTLNSKKDLVQVYERIVDCIGDKIEEWKPQSTASSMIKKGLFRLEALVRGLGRDDLSERVRKVRLEHFPQSRSLSAPPLMVDDLSASPVGIVVPDELRPHLRYTESVADFSKGECVAVLRTNGSLCFGWVIEAESVATRGNQYLAAYQKKNGEIRQVKDAVVYVLVSNRSVRRPDGTMSDGEMKACSGINRIGRISGALAGMVEDAIEDAQKAGEARKRQRTLNCPPSPPLDTSFTPRHDGEEAKRPRC